MLKKVFVIVFAVSALSLLLAGGKKDEATTDPAATPPATETPK